MAVTSVLFFSLAVLVTWCSAREYNCTIDESMCTGNGMQSIVVSGARMCCPPQATFTLDNGDCKCVEPTVADEPCLQGVPQCRQAASFSTDSKGDVRCCLPGYALNSVAKSVVNGLLLDACTCTPLNSPGGFLSTFLGMRNGPPPPPPYRMMPHHGHGPFHGPHHGHGSFPGPPPPPGFGGGPDPNLNATEVRAEWKKIGDEWRAWTSGLGQGFRTWGRNFGQRMRGTGLDLARSLSGVLQTTLNSSVRPMQRAFNDMIGHAFSSIPGFRGT